MLKIILQSRRPIVPFNEPARDLRVQNKPLWLLQRDVLAPYTTREIELPPGAPLPQVHEPCIVYRDNLFFDDDYIRAFLEAAQKANRPVRAAFSITDPAFREHILPLSLSYTPAGELYLADLWYYPRGPEPGAEPLVIDLLSREIGYYHIPLYMAASQGDLVYQVPLRSLIAIDSWVHIFIADEVFGLFGRGARFEERLNRDPFFKLKLFGKALYEGRQVLKCSGVVQIGRNCVIDPDAIIHGPTTIGDNVTIGANAVIENCIIGDNVNISQGCQLMLSVIGDGTFLPFRASTFMTTVMDNCLIAQNTCLQMCVIGRNTFIGAGSTWTDFNLLSAPIKARDGAGQLRLSNRPVLGGCVGHNCRIGSGMIVYPARIIESDVVLFASKERRVIDRDIYYEDSDHHRLKQANLHKRLYPRPGEEASESW
ncbi:MAG TPA: multidrug transporter [Anaerolinea thermolimosa]|uniref:Multidrug transporter n=1 Tax=Anaerolinea thermolimosa TaxID=229919 RepID=A0A3D1JL31_9CHLR|nr:DapH/DapD/GlmU-related protein [Anaerolinea thermolimosa]GAP05458.1 N-acetylglucosamine-1-phosphate uridyltransferase [Anaerolinea thermolimosa]HCE18468.1 multidrug transporter [Anaerolinea thermolimosa]